MATKYKTVRRSWLSEEQAREFVAAANARKAVRFDGRCWDFVTGDGTSGGAMTVFRLRLLPDEACADLD